jgi:UDP-N-acetylmuramate: L-alanyl-gamma-D-glutamyl-meso-diaminopimelate ligase
MGVDEAEFYKDASFKGPLKTRENCQKVKLQLLIKILHTLLSKVAATTQAVKEQYPNRTLVACLELHTYSV